MSDSGREFLFLMHLSSVVPERAVFYLQGTSVQYLEGNSKSAASVQLKHGKHAGARLGRPGNDELRGPAAVPRGQINIFTLVRIRN